MQSTTPLTEIPFRRVIDTLAHPVLVADRRERIVYANVAATDLLGYERDGLDGRKLKEVLPQRLVGGAARVPVIRKDGSSLVVEVTLSFVAPGTEGSLQIAWLRELREEEPGASQPMREATRARDEFLSIASHELNTPLTSLSLQLEVLRRSDQFTGPGRQKLEVADRSLARLTRVVDQLLEVSRLTFDPLRLNGEPLDLAVVVRDAVDRAADSIARSSSTVTLNTTPAPGRWDRVRMEQVATNLLSNAIRFGQGKPIEITVRSDGRVAELTVRDYGIGIDAADHSRIFERFERAVSSRHYGGFGLGLWIVRQIVAASGGTVCVESALGQGTTFIVQLPVLTPSDPPPAP